MAPWHKSSPGATGKGSSRGDKRGGNPTIFHENQSVLRAPESLWWLWLQKVLHSLTNELRTPLPRTVTFLHTKLCADEPDQMGYGAETLGLNTMARTEG